MRRAARASSCSRPTARRACATPATSPRSSSPVSSTRGRPRWRRRPPPGASVVACGERWAAPGVDGPLRFAIEDLLGAGAVLDALAGARLSPDAAAAVAAFRAAASSIEEHLLRCESGRELVDAGYGDDVRHAARIDAYEHAVVQLERRLVADPGSDPAG
jgi:hypothetical protein